MIDADGAHESLLLETFVVVTVLFCGGIVISGSPIEFVFVVIEDGVHESLFFGIFVVVTVLFSGVVAVLRSADFLGV